MGGRALLPWLPPGLALAPPRHASPTTTRFSRLSCPYTYWRRFRMPGASWRTFTGPLPLRTATALTPACTHYLRAGAGLHSHGATAPLLGSNALNILQHQRQGLNAAGQNTC